MGYITCLSFAIAKFSWTPDATGGSPQVQPRRYAQERRALSRKLYAVRLLSSA